MIKELDQVALTRRVPEHGLEPGDIGVVVYLDDKGRGLIVEFVTLLGETIAVVDLEAGAVRSLQPRELANARAVA